MSRVDATAPDRLPWLPDEPTAIPARRRGGLTVSASVALVTVAAGAFWIGARGGVEPAAPAERSAPTAIIHLPAPRTAEPEVRMPAQREIAVGAAPQVRPAPDREVRIPPPPSVSSAPRKTAKTATVPEEQAKVEPPAPATRASIYVPPKPWNPRVLNGAAGRLVQVGAFGSIHQAKRGWWFMVRAYPAVAHLPSVVRPSRNSKGRVFYRFQVGTTSQAHSEILCQRMEYIRLSCAVVGLPWKARVER